MTAAALLALPREELVDRVVAAGGRPFHADVARRELLANGVTDYAAMTALPTDVRRALAAEVPLLAGRELERRVADDGTTKLLLELPPRTEGGAPVAVETVHIPPRDQRSRRGATLCVSSQAGCPVGCPFCASGLAGLARNLAAHEIVEQYVRGRAVGPLSRSVVMGIGEPLLNRSAVVAALDVVMDELGIGGRKLTVSTVGFPDRLRALAATRPRFQLALSLHTPDQEQRDVLVPAMRGVPIEDVLSAADAWFEETGREVTIEYALLGGENDSKGHADRLVERLAGRRCTVNLIPFNPSPELPFVRPTEDAVDAFRARLAHGGLVATVRWSRGLDGAAACGQLRLQHA